MTDASMTGPQIGSDTELWRRINPIWWIWDAKVAGRRLSSAAFYNSSDGSGTSVVVARETSETRFLAGYPDHGIAALTAKDANDNGQTVRRVPTPGVPEHAQIEGEKTQAVRKALARACRIVVTPVISQS